jgi:hypothetical protein
MSDLDSARLRVGNLTFFPVLHGRVEFAAAVRHAILFAKPDAVAIELPVNLEKAYLKAVDRLPEISALMLESSFNGSAEEEQASYIVVEPTCPFTEAIRSAQETGAKIHFVEPPSLDRPLFETWFPDSYAAFKLGYDQYVEQALKFRASLSEQEKLHAANIATNLQSLDPSQSTLVVISLDTLHAVLERILEPQPENVSAALPYNNVTLVNPSPASLVEICVEYPFLQARYEDYRLLMDKELLDRLVAQNVLLREAELAYQINTGDSVRPQQRRQLAKYSRNLALIDHQLAPNLFDLVVAARSIIDDNYAWEVHHLAGRYEAQQTTKFPETVDLSAEEVFFNLRRTRIRRRLPRRKSTGSLPQNLKKRAKEGRPGEWAEQLDGFGICSYPPEDLVIEDYGRSLKKRAGELLSAERQRTERFQTSMLDGIDIRETVRNWYQGQVFVQQLEKSNLDVGSVIVIFDQNNDDRYYYTTTWLGEHQNESDMAFYSTHPFDHLIGPGIGRAEYGGFLMTLPSRRLYDVWNDHDYDFAESKAERLLLAGLDYSQQRNVVYVAPRPPRSMMQSIAARWGKRIVYIPIGQMSADKVKKLRVVHVLDGHDKREIAKDYLW